MTALGAWRFEISGTQIVSPLTITLPAPRAKDPTADPDTAFIAYFDPSTRAWVPMPSTYDASRHVVTAQSTHLSLWSVFRFDGAALTRSLTDFLGGFAGAPGPVNMPTCDNPDAMANSGYRIAQNADSGVTKTCAGLSGTQAQLKIMNNRGFGLAADYPDTWTKTPLGNLGLIDSAIGAFAAGLSPAPLGRKTAILMPGAGVQFTSSGSDSATRASIATIEPDPGSYLAAAMDYVIETMTLVSGEAGTKVAAEDVVKIVASLHDDASCIDALTGLLHNDVTDANSVATLLREDIDANFGCLKDAWARYYGGNGAALARLAAVITWLADGVRLVIEGVQAAVWTATHFALQQYQILGHYTKTGTQNPPPPPPAPASNDPNASPATDPGQQPLPAGARELGGVDLERYCQQFDDRHADLRYPNTWGWRCGVTTAHADRQQPGDYNISVDDACAQQYGGNAQSHYRRYDDRYSWFCWTAS